MLDRVKDYERGAKQVWAREHQLKVYAECFEKVGFRIIHKNEILKELAEENRRNFPKRKTKACNPLAKKTKQRKPHPEEASDKLPPELKDKHCETYWQVCLELGCNQGKKEA